MKAGIKTVEEIEDLKSSWEVDPHWDIEDTEGFEGYYNSLRAYRKQKEVEWHREAMQKVKDKAEDLGCPGNLKLAAYVMRLESRLEKLESEVVIESSNLARVSAR